MMQVDCLEGASMCRAARPAGEEQNRVRERLHVRPVDSDVAVICNYAFGDLSTLLSMHPPARGHAPM